MSDSLDQKYPGAVRFQFGDSDAMSRELIELVRAGKKRATCARASDFGEGGEAPPVVGRHDIVTHMDGTPALVIRTLSVEFKRFDQMDADFALAEGENETLDGWIADHRAYFERNGGWTADMELLCERFELVEDLEKQA